MFQVRIHGRGGQGVVTAAEMLSIAAFLEGKYAQAFPSFGSERMGAPVLAFCRISDQEIRLREPIQEPDAIIVQDETVIKVSHVFEGLVDSGYALINSSHDLKPPKDSIKLKTVNATEIALKTVGRPIPNAALLGSFSALTNIVKLDSILEAIKTKFSGSIAEKNILAAQTAYDEALRG